MIFPGLSNPDPGGTSALISSVSNATNGRNDRTEPGTPLFPFLSDLVHQFLIVSSLKSFSPAEPPAEGPFSAVEFKDDQGNPVLAPSHKFIKNASEDFKKKSGEPESLL